MEPWPSQQALMIVDGSNNWDSTIAADIIETYNMQSSINSDEAFE